MTCSGSRTLSLLSVKCEGETHPREKYFYLLTHRLSQVLEPLYKPRERLTATSGAFILVLGHKNVVWDLR